MTNYRRKPRGIQPPQTIYVINDNIRSSEVRVITETNEMLGIMPTRKALQMAFDQDLDLIEINNKAEPIVCKLMDFSKFKFQQEKLEASKPPIVEKEKTIRLSVRIALNDLQINAKKADEFLLKKTKVKIQIKMRGRERSHPQLALEVMDQFLKLIVTPFDFIANPKLDGDSNICTIKFSKKPN
jgi:translation initiation factor IF-3